MDCGERKHLKDELEKQGKRWIPNNKIWWGLRAHVFWKAERDIVRHMSVSCSIQLEPTNTHLGRQPQLRGNR